MVQEKGLPEAQQSKAFKDYGYMLVGTYREYKQKIREDQQLIKDSSSDKLIDQSMLKHYSAFGKFRYSSKFNYIKEDEQFRWEVSNKLSYNTPRNQLMNVMYNVIEMDYNGSPFNKKANKKVLHIYCAMMISLLRSSERDFKKFVDEADPLQKKKNLLFYMEKIIHHQNDMINAIQSYKILTFTMVKMGLLEEISKLFGQMLYLANNGFISKDNEFIFVQNFMKMTSMLHQYTCYIFRNADDERQNQYNQSGQNMYGKFDMKNNFVTAK
mmetsp:Transcript_8764/g.8087  ORF Transcript_8764/g.8087 Transcript_8764/m.8087 type:complete len:269 (+) Transcript_8764:862-1668(+)